MLDPETTPLSRHSRYTIPLPLVPNKANFPYALSVLPETLATQWDSPSFRPYRDAFPASHRTSPSAFSSHVHDLMAQDVKIPYLKALQGHLWQHGYATGALRCPLFPDVHPSLLRWHAAGIPILIYSSGSVPAQKLLFQYTDSSPGADLRPLISAYFDTVNAGPKTARESYELIARTRGEPVDGWLFLSDNLREVDAAREAGMQSYVVVREGNAELSEEEKRGHTLVSSFEGLMVGV
ncbi:2,3-diketo-5-methylthio-1-phosphopentane phosphatase [Hyphodiscus hymeniophilus]|uniref:2,3-diketo-5-methylthio-1-phosphopentane phosphatase n=1 Tax=Hyphodiscus hymeniophilus TaxID=353542 RepID=A0A9P6VIV1_9HELO|nr:2,3-diketo-5-methylthio-1-phosphopentane phosphatase [Hyphodiscus hymeniophilus]